VHAANHASDQLLAGMLGGAGDDERSLVTLFQWNANHPNMSSFERQVQVPVLSGETRQFRALPVYDGANSLPIGITLTAKDSGRFSLDVSVPNVNGLARGN
jgi:filamentous hemagglutinin